VAQTHSDELAVAKELRPSTSSSDQADEGGEPLR
jgi:hypothetical protein